MKKKVIIIVSIILVIGVVGIGMYYLGRNGNNDTKNSGTENNINQTGVIVEKASISFANMKIDNPKLKLTDEQKEVLKYFDKDYFSIANYSNLQRYPKIYKGSQIKIGGQVKKIIKSTDTEYEILVTFSVDPEYQPEEEMNQDELFIIKGEQTDKRLIVGDLINIYGRYNDISTCEIDGTSYTLPTITAFNVVEVATDRFSLDTITKVAKYIFGNDIKIKEAQSGVDYEGNAIEEVAYLVTLDNQSNQNFKSFLFNKNNSAILDLRNYTEGYAKGGSIRNIYVAADLEHYIITVYEPTTKQMYLEYYSKDLKKLWSREFTNVDSVPMDYTSEHIMCIADNDLYLIDTTNGENLIEPTFVGEKSKVQLLEDGALLIGHQQKDMIMKVDLKGNIVWKVSTKADNNAYEGANIQIVDDNFIIGWQNDYMPDDLDYAGPGYSTTMYMVLDSKGNIILENDKENVE